MKEIDLEGLWKYFLDNNKMVTGEVYCMSKNTNKRKRSVQYNQSIKTEVKKKEIGGKLTKEKEKAKRHQKNTNQKEKWLKQFKKQQEITDGVGLGWTEF